MTLIGGLAKGWFGSNEESAVFTGVIDLDQLTVFILGGEAVAGEEVGIRTVEADPEQAAS